MTSWAAKYFLVIFDPELRTAHSTVHSGAFRQRQMVSDVLCLHSLPCMYEQTKIPVKV
jgi:hypothetical protein